MVGARPEADAFPTYRWRPDRRHRRRPANRGVHGSAAFFGRKPCNCKHAELAQKYCADLEHRVDGGEIEPRTADRYRAAIQHYLAFAGNRPSPERIRRSPRGSGLSIAVFGVLANRQVLPNGHANSRPALDEVREFVVDVVRGLYAWAADPQRGDLLPHGFHNPFAGARRQTASVATDPIGEPDITVPMAVELLAACDTFQLSVFAPLLLYGLRPGELGWLFWGARRPRMVEGLLPSRTRLLHEGATRQTLSGAARAARFPSVRSLGRRRHHWQHLSHPRNQRQVRGIAGVLHHQPPLQSAGDRPASALALEHRELTTLCARCNIYRRCQSHS